jgi:hypothetical protein
LKVPVEIDFSMQDWAREWFPCKCESDASVEEQMFLYEWFGKDMKMANYLRQLPLQIFPDAEWEMPIEEETYFSMAENLVANATQTSYIQKVVQATQPEESMRVEEIKKELLERYKDTVFRPHFGGMPPKRGPHGEATFNLKPGAEPTTIKPFTLVGKRREAMNKLITQLEE